MGTWCQMTFSAITLLNVASTSGCLSAIYFVSSSAKDINSSDATLLREGSLISWWGVHWIVYVNQNHLLFPKSGCFSNGQVAQFWSIRYEASLLEGFLTTDAHCKHLFCDWMLTASIYSVIGHVCKWPQCYGSHLVATRGILAHGGCGAETWKGWARDITIIPCNQTCSHWSLNFLLAEMWYFLIFKASRVIVFYYLKPRACQLI